ncbi:hypothetical protein ACFS6H_04470 [Terrimonas rubra]|uniref:Uncharacterized protein n=1 Tax=Terrimonas rubra TaxID=1035890 RepID=A0ABW6A1S2_9BACT
MKHFMLLLFFFTGVGLFNLYSQPFAKTKNKITIYNNTIYDDEASRSTKTMDTFLSALSATIDRKGNNIPIKIYWDEIPIAPFDFYSCETNVVLSYDRMKTIDDRFIDDYFMFNTSEKSKDFFLDFHVRYLSRYRLKKLKRLQEGPLDIKSSYYNNKTSPAIFIFFNTGYCEKNRQEVETVLQQSFERIYSVAQYAIDSFNYIKNNQKKISIQWNMEAYTYLKDFDTRVSVYSIDTNIVKNIPLKKFTVPYTSLVVDEKKDYTVVSLRIIGISILIISLFYFILHKILIHR